MTNLDADLLSDDRGGWPAPSSDSPPEVAPILYPVSDFTMLSGRGGIFVGTRDI